MVLHTWNQELEHHPHIHALVPAAGPSLDGTAWKVARHPKHVRRKKPYLTDVVELGIVFRKHYLRGLKNLLRKNKLKLGGNVAFLADHQQQERWLMQLESTFWNVFAEGPPQRNSDPANVVKYLARYLTGGPLADQRIIRADDNEVHFWARPKQSDQQPNQQPNQQSTVKVKRKKKRKRMNASRPFRLSASQFIQRWSLHILPKGFVRTRRYGGYHASKRDTYLQQCQDLLHPNRNADHCLANSTGIQESSQVPEQTQSKCPHCGDTLKSIRSQFRPSWRKIFAGQVDPSTTNNPPHHHATGRSPPQATKGNPIRI